MITALCLASIGLAGRAPALEAQSLDSTLQLSLGAALNLAETASENVGIAKAGVGRSRGQQLQARSGYFPQLTGSATYTRTIRSQFSSLQSGSDTAGTAGCRAFSPDPSLPIGERVDSLESALNCLSTANPFAAFRNLPFGREHQYNFGLSLSQTIFDRRLGGQTAAANAAHRSAEIGLESSRAAVLVDVTAAYYDAILSDRLLSIAESTLVQAERTLRDVELGREVGTQPEFELLRARVNRDNQRPAMIQRQTNRDLAYLRLKQLLDLPLRLSLSLTTDLGDTTRIPLPPGAADLSASRDTSIAARAPVRQAAEAVRAAEGRRQVASGQQLPSLKLSSTFARIAFPSSTFDLGTEFVSDWNVALRLEVPLFTGGRIRGDKMVARADLDQARLQLEQSRELAALENQDVMSQLDAARARWDASVGTVEQATRAYEIAEVRFREGISTQTELSDSRLLLQQAQANRAQAARDLQVAKVRADLLHDLPFSSPTSGGSAVR
ncbi:MAG: TolC family protein [Gemmatimonadota bacterium]